MIPCSWTTPSFLFCNTSEAVDSSTQLLNAVNKGDLKHVETLLSTHAYEINDLFHGESLLSTAVKNGSIPMIRLLLKYGAALDTRDDKNMTSLDYAVLSPYRKEVLPALIGELVQQNQDRINAILNDSRTMQLAEMSLVSLIKELKEVSLPECTRYSLPYAELSEAFAIKDSAKIKQCFEAVRELFPKALDASGNTFLHFLASKNMKVSYANAIFTLCAEQGIDLNIKNHLGQTPLHIASASQSIAKIQVLAVNQGDLFQSDHQNIPAIALIFAAARSNDPLKLERFSVLMAAFIVASGAINYALDANGSHYSVAGLVTIQELLAYGHTLSPWLFAICTGTTEVIWNALAVGLISLGCGPHTTVNFTGSCLRFMVVAQAALLGLEAAWTHKSWHPLKALRNACVHTINLGDCTYKSMRSINLMVTDIWHGRLLKESMTIEGKQNHLKTQLLLCHEALVQKNNLSRSYFCPKDSYGRTLETCEESIKNTARSLFTERDKNMDRLSEIQKLLRRKFF